MKGFEIENDNGRITIYSVYDPTHGKYPVISFSKNGNMICIESQFKFRKSFFSIRGLDKIETYHPENSGYSLWIKSRSYCVHDFKIKYKDSNYFIIKDSMYGNKEQVEFVISEIIKLIESCNNGGLEK